MSAANETDEGFARRLAREALATKGLLLCDFCSKSQSQVQKLIAGSGGGLTKHCICNECMGGCNEILAEEGST
jgi:hypothetical protein